MCRERVVAHNARRPEMAENDRYMEPNWMLPMEGQDMDSYSETDAIYPKCFNHLLDEPSSTPDVEQVDGLLADGCVSVTHQDDEPVLEWLVASVGTSADEMDRALDRRLSGTCRA